MMKNKLIKSLLLTGLILFSFCIKTSAEIIYNVVDAPFLWERTHGTKIKTTIPFVSNQYVAFVQIKGVNYGPSKHLSLEFGFTIYGDNFYYAGGSSSGSSIPDVILGEENGYVVIFLNETVTNQRFVVNAGTLAGKANPSYFTGWTVTDEPITATTQKKVTFQNNFMGKVGINTSSPKYELDVNGVIRGREVKIEIDKSWPDFVFKKDYKLPTLNEVKTHIDEHQHLPGIPSEAEVKENGIGVSDITSKLLQKIEELTLYVIQQQDEINILKKEIKEIKK